MIHNPNRLQVLLICLAIFLAALLTNVLFGKVLTVSIQAGESSDYDSTYRPAAYNLLAGKGYTLDGQHTITYYPPGYSLILAGLFRLADNPALDASAVVGFNLLASSATSVLVFLLACQVFGALPGIFTAVLWMTYPFSLWLVHLPNTEIPFLLFFIGSAFAFWRARTSIENLPERLGWLALSGVLYGCALMIRPFLIGLWILWGVFWLVASWNVNKQGRQSQQRFQPLLEMAIFIVCILLLVIPWELKLFRSTGQLVPVSTAGPTSIRDGLTYGIRLKDYRQEVQLPTDVEHLMLDIHRLELTDITLSQLTYHFLRQPLAFSKLLLLKALRSWYATDSARFEAIILPIQLVYLLLILWGLISAWKSRGAAQAYAAFVALTALYFWLATTSALSILRYMIPAMCLLMTLIPAGLSKLPPLKKYFVLKYNHHQP